MQPGQKCPKCGTTWHYINGKGAPPSAPVFTGAGVSMGVIAGVVTGLIILAGVVFFVVKVAS